MDINYLLFLQNIRNYSWEGFSVFFNFVSESCVLWFFYVPFIVYWCVSKKAGYWIMLNYTCTDTMNILLKNTFCIYRPWIRDSRIIPYGDLKITTNSYSFPSGHTATAASIGGSVCFWQRNKNKWLSSIILVYVLLVGFSRNFLGVHTPQDVIVAIVEAAAIIWLNSKIFEWINDNDKHELTALAIGLFITVIYVIYILVKPYPIDYINGQLIVSSLQMQADACKAVGAFSSFIICGYIERHYVGFSIQGRPVEKILRGFIGIAVLICYTSYLRPPIIQALGTRLGNFTAYFIMYAIGLLIYPFIVNSYQINRLYHSS